MLLEVRNLILVELKTKRADADMAFLVYTIFYLFKKI